MAMTGTLGALSRKISQAASDPVLRRWILARAFGQVPPASRAASSPPYLNGAAAATQFGPTRPLPFAMLPANAPTEDIVLPLPGQAVVAEAGSPSGPFGCDYRDLETFLALQRFAWLPLLGNAVDPRWVTALWHAWCSEYASIEDRWGWHPYTAAERSINILDYARRRGLPGPQGSTLNLLAEHGRRILAGLEYFGEGQTGNHLSNDGRGLFRIGLALGIADLAEIGGQIMLEEVGRIFMPSGVMREGSSHYHLLLARNFADAWLAARAHDRPETEALAETVRRALAVLPVLVLPGGMPLVGDISPDCPPQFLGGLMPGGEMNRGWTGLLEPSDRDSLGELIAEAGAVSRDKLSSDGWWRIDTGPWSALMYVSPDGWPPAPGHGHQDLGGFEVHFGDVPLFRDPGRGSYDMSEESKHFASVRAHNAVEIDGADPYPPVRPYYDADFRRRIDGGTPTVQRNEDSITLTHRGYSRLTGLGAAVREWRFDSRAMTIVDRIEGFGRHSIVRRFHTIHDVAVNGANATIVADGRQWRFQCESDVTAKPGKCWVAYGESVPATVIEIAETVILPATLSVTVEMVT